ncbi:hypothetical protein LAB1_15490 [Roseibium sp. LAB1]
MGPGEAQDHELVGLQGGIEATCGPDSVVRSRDRVTPLPKVKPASEIGGYERRGRKSPGWPSLFDEPDHIAKRRKDRIRIEVAE